MSEQPSDPMQYLHDVNVRVAMTMRARSMVEHLILSRKLYLPDPDGSREELEKFMDPLVEREARAIIVSGNLEECVETFIMGFDLLANGEWNRTGRQGECPHVKREELEWNRQTLDDLFLVQYTEWMRKVFKRLESERPKIERASLSSETLAKYDEIVKDTPVPGISNEELVAMVTPEEADDAINYLLTRSRRILDLQRRGLLSLN